MSSLSGLFNELHENMVALKAVKFGFEARLEQKKEAATSLSSSSVASKEDDSWKTRVQYVQETELELDVMLSERRLEAAVALIEQSQGPLEALKKRVQQSASSSIASTSSTSSSGKRLSSTPDAASASNKRAAAAAGLWGEGGSAQQALEMMERRIAQVALALTTQLTSPAIAVQEARVLVGLLRRMHLEPQARDYFLSARTQHVQAAVKQVKPDSNRPGYIRSLSRQVFGMLCDTCSDYMACFGETGLALATLNVWLLQETHSFGELWIRNVISRGDSVEVLTLCMTEALSHSRMLEIHGFYFERMLRKQLRDAFLNMQDLVCRRIETRVMDKLQKEDWYATPQSHKALLEAFVGSVLSNADNISGLIREGSTPKFSRRATAVHSLMESSRKKVEKEKDTSSLLTPSAVSCIRLIHAFLRDTIPGVSDDLVYDVSMKGFGLVEFYISALAQRLESPMNDQQLLGLAGDVVWIVLVLSKSLDGLIEKRMAPFLQAQVERLWDQLRKKFCERKAFHLLYRSWQLSWNQYADVKGVPNSPSKPTLKLFEWLKMFRNRLVQQVSTIEGGVAQVEPVAVLLLEYLVDFIYNAEEALWSHLGSLPREAIVQLALDFRWIQEASTLLKCTSQRAQKGLESSFQRALLEYCAHKGLKDPSSVLPKPDWFKETLAPHLESLLAAP